MGNSRLPFVAHLPYHVYNRGLGKKKLFFTDRDYELFQDYMIRFLQEYEQISILSYCLLPNHFHIILIQTEDSYAISEYMQHLSVAYAVHYKRAYEQSMRGIVFEGRFRAKHLATDVDLETCMLYVNYNAQKHEIVNDASTWKYSSIHSFYTTNHTQPVPIQTDISLVGEGAGEDPNNWEYPE